MTGHRPPAGVATEPELRLSLTLGSGASLGAYEAGAVAALLTAVRALRTAGVGVRVDTISAASAGALVGLAAARLLVTGLDPVTVLHHAWVELGSTTRMRSRGRRSPLSQRRVRRILRDVLTAESVLPLAQQQPVRLYVATTNLQGLRYDVPTPLGGRAHRLATWSDGGEVELTPGQELRELFEPEHASAADLVLASASHPAAFAPHRLERLSAADGDRRRGTSAPEQAWFTDGGMVDARLLGRALDAARRLDVDPDRVRRVHVVVDPGQAVLPPEGEFTGARAPSWPAGLLRAASLAPMQSLYDDVARVADANVRLERRDALVDALVDALGDRAGHDLCRALRADADADPATDVRGALVSALDEVGDLRGKRHAMVELLSPRVLQTDRDDPALAELLAGRPLGHFAGFLSRDLRRSDFALGYESGRGWLPGALERAGLPASSTAPALAEVGRRRDAAWGPPDRGGAGVAGLSPAARLRLTRVAVHAASVLVRGTRS